MGPAGRLCTHGGWRARRGARRGSEPGAWRTVDTVVHRHPCRGLRPASRAFFNWASARCGAARLGCGSVLRRNTPQPNPTGPNSMSPHPRLRVPPHDRRPGRPTGTLCRRPWLPAMIARPRWPLGSTCEPTRPQCPLASLPASMQHSRMIRPGRSCWRAARRKTCRRAACGVPSRWLRRSRKLQALPPNRRVASAPAAVTQALLPHLCL